MLWCVFSLLMTSFYTCNLRVNMIRPLLEEPVNSAEEAVDRDLKVFLPNIPSLRAQFVQSPLKAYRQIYAIARKKGSIYNLWGPGTDAQKAKEGFLKRKVTNTFSIILKFTKE